MAQSVALVAEWDARPALGPTLRAAAFAAAMRASRPMRVGFRATSRPEEAPTFRFMDLDHLRTLESSISSRVPAVVAAGSWASFAAAVSLPAGIPLWVDLFGDPIGEGLARAKRLGSPEPLARNQYLLRRVLDRADAISVVSQRQRLVVLGQLGALGRIHPQLGPPPVHAIPCCLPHPIRPRVPRATARALVAGSANSWIDVDLLFAALEIALDRVPALEVDVTGGSLPGYDEETFARLRAKAEASRHRPRLHLHGWLDDEGYRQVLARADFGIVPETIALERELGSANRCLEWIAEGLPFTISSQSEMATDLGAVEAVELHTPGNVADLSRAIEALASNPERRTWLASNAAAYAQEYWTAEVACRPLTQWLQAPRCHDVATAASASVSRALEPTSGPAPAPPAVWVPWSVEARHLALRGTGAVTRRARRLTALVTQAVTSGGRVVRETTTTFTARVGRELFRFFRTLQLLGSVVRLGFLALSPRRKQRTPVASEPNRRPRLVVACPYPLLPSTAGGTVRVRALLEALAVHVDICLLSFASGRDAPGQRFGLAAPGLVQRFVPHVRGASEGSDLDPPAVRPFRSAELRDAIRDACAEHAADIVQLEFTELGQFLGTVPAGVPTVLTELDVGFVTALRRRRQGFHTRYAGDRRLWGSWWDWLRLLRFEVTAARRANQLQMMSDADAKALGRLAPRAHLVTVPNGVTIPPAASGSRDPELVLFLGFFGHSPNRDAIEWFLAEIWPRVRHARPTAHLVVLGGMVPSEVAARHGQQGIEILGQVPEVGSWLRRCAVFVAPIRAGSGTRLKLLEAFAHEAACVSTSLGAEGIEVTAGEHLLIADEAVGFGEAVVALLDDPRRAAKLGESARSRVAERYTWQRSAAVALAGYHELMAEAPRPDRPTAEVDPPSVGEPPAISIVIPTYHGGPRLLQVLEAIAAQRGTPAFEVICVDSGSSEEELGSMRGHGARVATIPNSAFDHGLTRDLGARLARGRVLVFLNQDAVPASTYWLALLTEPLLRPGRLDAVQGGITEIPERAGRFFWDSGGGRFYYTRETTRWMEEYHGLGFSTINCAIRREAWEAIHFGWAPIMEDKKWQARAARQGRFIGQRHQAAVQHSHDWSSAGLWRRCRSEGEGWALLDRAYTFGDALADLCHRKTWREWGRALLRGELRSKAELAFPIVRPLALWRGGRRVLAPHSPHRPRIRYSPEIVPAEIMEVPR